MNTNDIIKGLPPCERPAAEVRVVETVGALRKLKNTFAYVVQTATTYFVGCDHQATVIASNPLFIDDYPALENPRRLRSQVVYDFRNDAAYVYNERGKVKKIQLQEVK